MLKKLIPVVAAIAAARLGRGKQPAASSSEPSSIGSSPVAHSGMSSTVGAMASAFIAEKFLPARTSILGKALAAALPVTIARYLKG